MLQLLLALHAWLPLHFDQLKERLKSLQGRKAPSREADLRSCWVGFEAVLSILGLWKDNPQEVLREMRQLALQRYSNLVLPEFKQ